MPRAVPLGSCLSCGTSNLYRMDKILPSRDQSPWNGQPAAGTGLKKNDRDGGNASGGDDDASMTSFVAQTKYMFILPCR